MAPLKILICGGGCAGPSLAFWLARTGHQVVVVERFEALRATGAQIDLRGQGIQVVKRMGLMEAIRAKLVDEEGMAMVDSNGKVKATMMANKSGKGVQTGTSEYEIMRGDLVRVLYDATMDKVKYIFGMTVERFEQDEKQVVAHFSDGSSDTFDLLVGADGQGSRIRKAIQPPGGPDPYRLLGVYAAYWFIPRIETDSNIARMYHATNGRMIMRRSHNATETQVYFFLRDHSTEALSLTSSSVEKQKEFWIARFRDAGWETGRFLEGLKTTDNFFCQKILQVKTDTWHKGRVVLLGDAAHCPSPMTAMGTTGSFVGSYVLAGEINRNSEDLSLAFRNYDATLRPFVNEIQKLHTFLIWLASPNSQWGIAVLHFVFGVLCFLRIPELLARFSNEDEGGWKLPDYPELEPGS